ncbi:MAG: hypothetical protein IJ716_05410 [Lachnospiraceae bacterium]|nr:hypothetical protein [Lachnospiraceae bacterium]
MDEIPAEEVTVSLFRDTYPKEMVEKLKSQGFSVMEKYPGVYQITGAGFFLTQLVVTSRLDGPEHAILRILSNHADQKDIETFISKKILPESNRFCRSAFPPIRNCIGDYGWRIRKCVKR